MNDRDAPPASHRSAIGIPPPTFAGIALAILVAGFASVGAYAPTELPRYVGSAREVVGMALMLTLLPPYLMFGAAISQRRSLALVEQTRPLLDDPTAADVAGEAIRTALRRGWPVGVGLGLVMGAINTNPFVAFRSNVPEIAGALSLGQLLIWQVIGNLIAVRVGAARAFRGLAGVVPIDVLRPDLVKSIARHGMIDVLLVMGAALLAPLQSLDLEFRWYNYHFAVIVAVPSAAFYLLWPVGPLHRRNRDQRDARIAEIDRQLAELGYRGASAPTDAEASARLEALLAHRDRLRHVRTWPLSTALLSRVILYLVIPPLAWAGAALVERVIDQALGG